VAKKVAKKIVAKIGNFCNAAGPKRVLHAINGWTQGADLILPASTTMGLTVSRHTVKSVWGLFRANKIIG
jgi:hypothetical protein